jgi:hypothetical protein
MEREEATAIESGMACCWTHAIEHDLKECSESVKVWVRG